MRLGALIIGIVMIVVAFLLFPIVLTSVHNMQTDKQTDANLTITDNVVTLSTALWHSDVDNVLSIASDNIDKLTAASYAPATRQLTLDGNTCSKKATPTYLIDGLTSFTGLQQLVTISPLLVFIGLLAGGGWLTFTGIRGEGGGRSRGRGLH